VLLVCEARGRFEEVERLLPPGAAHRPTLRVRTKADLPLAAVTLGGSPDGAESHAGGASKPPGSAAGRREGDAPAEVSSQNALAVCALDGWQLPVLRRAIADAAMDATHAIGEVLPRHRASIARAAVALGQTLARIDPAHRALPDPEVAAAGMRAALDCLGEISGRTTPDDILGRVFASFCVGK
jgi:tRNA modification GTPase